VEPVEPVEFVSSSAGTAVVGVAGATTRLKTGDRIRIDGTLGTVGILERAPAMSQATTTATVP
jgi:hypothetical protein